MAVFDYTRPVFWPKRVGKKRKLKWSQEVALCKGIVIHV